MKMAVPQDAIPSLSECQCAICMDILIEPVTLPCDHTLCKQCFQSTLEKASLCCPFCRRRISSWARYHAPRNSLINMQLWQMIQKHYPTECKLKMSGQESEEDIDDLKPVPVLSTPGDLTSEYEEEVRQMEAERRTLEEENQMNDQHIQTLLAEEWEEERQKAEERREMEEQLKRDEELARKLSSNINDWDRNVLPPSSSGELRTVTDKSQTKSKKKLSDAGDTPKYVSPTFQFASTSQSEVVQESREISASEATDSIVLKNPMWQDIEIEEDVPTCFLQTGLDAEDQGAQPSAEPPVPQLDVTGRESCLKRKMKMTGGSRDEEVPALNHQGPEAGAPCFGETESACTPQGGTHLEIPNKVMSETENKEAWLLISNDTAKGTTQEASFEAGPDPCISPKRRKVFPKASTVQDKSEINVTQNLIDTEHSLLEKNKQEELDWLFAFEVQKKLIKEQKTPDRQKGSLNEYQLRGTSSLSCQLLSGLKNHSKGRNFKRQTDRACPKSPRRPESENQQK